MRHKILVTASISIEAMQDVWLALLRRWKLEQRRLDDMAAGKPLVSRACFEMFKEETDNLKKELARVSNYLRLHHPPRWEELMERIAREKDHPSGTPTGSGIPIRPGAGQSDAPASGSVSKPEQPKVVDSGQLSGESANIAFPPVRSRDYQYCSRIKPADCWWNK